MQCLLCGKEITVNEGMVDNATFFESYGNYGSTLWDPLNENLRLETVICDECLKLNLDKIQVVHSRREYKETYRKPYLEWEQQEYGKKFDNDD